jgi:hypothetical protein
MPPPSHRQARRSGRVGGRGQARGGGVSKPARRAGRDWEGRDGFGGGERAADRPGPAGRGPTPNQGCQGTVGELFGPATSLPGPPGSTGSTMPQLGPRVRHSGGAGGPGTRPGAGQAVTSSIPVSRVAVSPVAADGYPADGYPSTVRTARATGAAACARLVRPPTPASPARARASLSRARPPYPRHQPLRARARLDRALQPPSAGTRARLARARRPPPSRQAGPCAARPGRGRRLVAVATCGSTLAAH